MKRQLFKALAPIAVAFGFLHAPATQAAVMISEGIETLGIPGLTNFATTGALMSGLRVAATFSNGLVEEEFWATTGPASGGVSGSGWGLSLTGDSFGGEWMFTIDPSANLGQLRMLVLDGRDALTVFDRTFATEGTPGSAAGLDFNCHASSPAVCVDNDAFVVYDYQVFLLPSDPPVGDLWQLITISFFDANENPSGPRTSWSFVQDTDNDSRLTAPEPGTLLLLAVAALGLWWRRRVA